MHELCIYIYRYIYVCNHIKEGVGREPVKGEDRELNFIYMNCVYIYMLHNRCYYMMYDYDTVL